MRPRRTRPMTAARALLATVGITVLLVWFSWGPPDTRSTTGNQEAFSSNGKGWVAVERPSMEISRPFDITEPVAPNPVPRVDDATRTAIPKAIPDDSELYMDPNDSSTWVERDIGRLNVGEPMDPNDPSTWRGSDVGRLNVGEPMDPNDSSTWGETDTGRLNVGEPMDPNDPSTWGSGSKVRINVGEPMDPNDFSTWGD